jgi:hypothetical protein
MSADIPYILYHWCIMREKILRAKGTKLRYETIPVKKSYSEVRTSICTEEQTIDCPDCFDTMFKICNWDRFSYLCENCGLKLANFSSLSALDSEE